jgi:WD40 repeat protein
VKTGKLRHTLKGHKNCVTGLAVSPDGRTLASSSSFQAPFRPKNAGPDDIRLWDINTGEPLGTIPVGVEKITSVAFSSDGSALAAIYWVKKDKAEGPKVKDDPRVELANRTLMVSVWDTKGNTLRWTREHTNAGDLGFLLDNHAAVAFNPKDGTLVSTGGRSLCIWTAATGALKRQSLLGIPEPGWIKDNLVALAISPDGKAIATGHFYTTGYIGTQITLWNAETGERVKWVDVKADVKLAFSPDGKNLVSVSRTALIVWDVLTFQQRLLVPAHQNGEPSVALGWDGQIIATASIAAPRPPNGVTTGVPEGPVEVKLWDASRSPVVTTLSGNLPIWLRWPIFGPPGTLIEPDRTGVIRLWDLEAGRVRTTVDSTKYQIGTYADTTVLSPDRRFVAGYDIIGTEEDRRATKGLAGKRRFAELTAVVNLLDVAAGTIRAIEVGKGPIKSMAFSPDSTRIALVHDITMDEGKTSVPGNTLEIWNLAANRSEFTIKFPVIVKAFGSVFSPDGQTVVVDALGTVPDKQNPGKFVQIRFMTVVDAKTGAIRGSIEARGLRFDRVPWFTPDSARFIVPLNPPIVWDVRANKVLAEPAPKEPTVDPTVSADGRYELRRVPNGIEVVDRKVTPPEVVARRAP